MYDLIIKNGTVIDGTGAPRIIANISIKDGKIVEEGEATIVFNNPKEKYTKDLLQAVI